MLEAKHRMWRIRQLIVAKDVDFSQKQPIIDKYKTELIAI